MQSSQPFWEQILLNAIGPVVTVALGTLVIGSTVAWLQRRREARQTLRDLTVDMFQVAFAFYTCVEVARRQRQYHEVETPAQDLDAAYQEFVVAGRSIEARLRVASPHQESQVNTRWLWHCVLDLLTCLFFHHRHSQQRTQDLIAGQQREHEQTRTGESIPEELLDRFLASAEMNDPDLVKTKFAAAMDQLILLGR